LVSTVEYSDCNHKAIYLMNKKENEIGLRARQFLSISKLPVRSHPSMSHFGRSVPFSGTTWASAIWQIDSSEKWIWLFQNIVVLSSFGFGFRGCSFLIHNPL
jgi:hypothetical protein